MQISVSDYISCNQKNEASLYTSQNGSKSGAPTTPNVVVDWGQEEHSFLMRMKNDLATLKGFDS